ncbi:MAG: STAS domain-containing protein [Spirochaetes bacterium]|nr:STAS domain-containing protein [Spirochaetota bacterium]
MPNESNIYSIRQGKDIALIFINDIMAVHSSAMYVYIKPLIEENKIKTIWINLNKCKTIDSTTIGTLVKMHKMLEEKRGCLFLCNPSKDVKMNLEWMGLIDFFNVQQKIVFTRIEKRFMNDIPLLKGRLTSEFVLDALEEILKISPHLKEEYKKLFNILHQDIKKKKHKK